MPKRATHTFESEKDGVHEEELGNQYCLCCGQSVLLLGPEAKYADLPRRRTDGAIVLERSTITFKLKTKEKEVKVLKREGGCERQFRMGCWNCGVLIAYRAEEAQDAALTYLLGDATGAQADLYLQMFQVPPCIQSTGDKSVRVAVDVKTSQSKRALRHVNDESVGVSVCAPAKEGLANAELVEYMGKVLSVTRACMSLSRGWSQNSKFLAVSGLKAPEVFKRLKAAVTVDNFGDLGQGIGGSELQGAISTHDDAAPVTATAGSASGRARSMWEDNAGLDEQELAAAPNPKQQTFRA